VQRVVQLAALAAVIACGVFFLWPAAAPHSFTSQLVPLGDWVVETLGERYRPLAWIVAATGITLIAAPLSVALSFIRRLDTLGTFLRRMAGGTARPGGGSVLDAGLGSVVGAGRDEFDEAVRSMSAAATERSRPARRRKLGEILDQ
jgi:hypothetical protein